MSLSCGTTIATLRGAGGSHATYISSLLLASGKHRRRFSGGAEVDLVAGEGVEELRSGRKLTPQHVDAEAGEGGFRALTGFQDPEAAEALVANAQFAIGPGCVGERPRRRRRAAAAFDQPEVSELGAQGMPADPQQLGRPGSGYRRNVPWRGESGRWSLAATAARREAPAGGE